MRETTWTAALSSSRTGKLTHCFFFLDVHENSFRPWTFPSRKLDHQQHKTMNRLCDEAIITRGLALAIVYSRITNRFQNLMDFHRWQSSKNLLNRICSLA
jgi:hypothetical protein